MLLGVDDKVGALDGAAADSTRIAICNDALPQPGSHIARLLVLELLRQVLLGLHPLLALVDGYGQPLVLVVCRVASLCCLGDLRFPDEALDRHVFVARFAAQGAAVGERRHREAVGRLDVAVAP